MIRSSSVIAERISSRLSIAVSFLFIPSRQGMKIIPQTGRKFSELEDYSEGGKIMRKSVISALLVVGLSVGSHYAAAADVDHEVHKACSWILMEVRHV